MAFETYDMDDLLNGRQAAAVAQVQPSLISYWRAHDHLHPVAYVNGNLNRPLYRRGDVLATERKMRRSPKSSRSKQRRGVLAQA